VDWPLAPDDPEDPRWADVAALWDLERGRDHLNHGSFGAVPLPVLAAQALWRARMERNPVRFFKREIRAGLSAARHRGAAFVGADPDAVALVTNATVGVNTVLATAGLAAGDEVVVTTHTYGAIRFAVDRACGRAGAKPVAAAFGVHDSDDEVVAAIVGAVTDRTAFAVIDHITSATARLLPIERIVEVLHERGVPVLVDAAHAPGMVDVDVTALGADAWVGNMHKWAFAARGTALLWVAPGWRARVQPLVVSWWEADGFPSAFDQGGTTDATAWLALPVALDLHDHLDAGGRLRSRNASLAALGQQRVADALGIEPAARWGSDGVAMRCVPLPERFGADPEALYDRLTHEAAVEVATWSAGGRCVIRLSGQAYVEPSAFDRLAAWLAAH
jgi:isopenicillin-N epimerase